MDPITIRTIAPNSIANQSLVERKDNSEKTERSFGQWLQQSLSEVNDLQQQADASAQRLIAGENKDIHGTMIAMQEASISFNLVMQIRNKVISAYDEIKRMQF